MTFPKLNSKIVNCITGVLTESVEKIINKTVLYVSIFDIPNFCAIDFLQNIRMSSHAVNFIMFTSEQTSL